MSTGGAIVAKDTFFRAFFHGWRIPNSITLDPRDCRGPFVARLLMMVDPLGKNSLQCF